MYENLSVISTDWNIDFFFSPWKSVCRFSYMKYGILYISCMKIRVEICLHKIWNSLYFTNENIVTGLLKIEPIWYWNHLYFTNENIATTVPSWNMEFFVFLIHIKRQQFSTLKYGILCIFFKLDGCLISFMDAEFPYNSHLKIRMEIFL